MYFYPKHENGDANGRDAPSSSFYNIEVAPPKQAQCNGNAAHTDKMSVIDIHEIKYGTCFTHCNRYMFVTRYYILLKTH